MGRSKSDRSNYVEVQQHPWSSQMVGEAVGFTFRIELWLLIYMQIITQEVQQQPMHNYGIHACACWMKLDI